jgi:hypothetical protein
VENGLIFLNAGVRTFLRECLGAGDIISVRKDIFNYLQTKRNLFLMRKFYTKFPFYNRLLKKRLITRAIRIERREKESGSAGAGYSALTAELYKKMLGTSDYLIDNPKSSSNPDFKLSNKKTRWHRHLKKMSALRFKSNVLSKINNQLNNINDGYRFGVHQQDSFM